MRVNVRASTGRKEKTRGEVQEVVDDGHPVRHIAALQRAKTTIRKQRTASSGTVWLTLEYAQAGITFGGPSPHAP